MRLTDRVAIVTGGGSGIRTLPLAFTHVRPGAGAAGGSRA